VIGNPPWLAFRHMSADLQKRFIALAEAAAEAEKIAARVEIPEGIRFQNARAFVRAALVEARVAPRIDVLVAELLSR
jgi:hypothetical protein